MKCWINTASCPLGNYCRKQADVNNCNVYPTDTRATQEAAEREYRECIGYWQHVTCRDLQVAWLDCGDPHQLNGHRSAKCADVPISVGLCPKSCGKPWARDYGTEKCQKYYYNYAKWRLHENHYQKYDQAIPSYDFAHEYEKCEIGGCQCSKEVEEGPCFT